MTKLYESAQSLQTNLEQIKDRIQREMFKGKMSELHFYFKLNLISNYLGLTNNITLRLFIFEISVTESMTQCQIMHDLIQTNVKGQF